MDFGDKKNIASISFKHGGCKYNEKHLFLIKQEILLTKQINIHVQEFLILYFFFVPNFFQKTLIFFYNNFKNIQQSLAM